MQRNSRDLLTVSPPTFDRTHFSRADRQLGSANAPYDRAWLMARFEEGLQIRMLPPPMRGIVLFQPGRLSWRPIHGLDNALVVHDMRVESEPTSRAAAGRLWDAVEGFARFYGFAVILAILGPQDGLISPDVAPGCGWTTFDDGPNGSRLAGRVISGPVALPRFPRDWSARAAYLGPGPVIQITEERRHICNRARRLIRQAAARGVHVRLDRLADPAEARARAVTPVANFAAIRDGVLLGGADISDADLLKALIRLPRP